MEKTKNNFYIKKNWCKQCGLCIEFCPKKVFKVGNDGYPAVDDIENCVQCGICIAMCPDFAIFTDLETLERFKER